MTDYIIYHQVKPGTDCPDGIVSAAIAYSALENAIVIPDCYKDASEYGSIPFGLPEFTKGDHLYIVDFSYPYEWLKYWEEQGVVVIVIDHHAPKFPMLKNFANAVLDANECGATLTWKHFYPDQETPELLRHVRNRDIGANGYYRGEIPDSEAINEGLSKIRYDLDSDDLHDKLKYIFNLLVNDKTDDLLTIGKPSIEERDRIVTEVVKRVEMRQLLEYEVPYVKLLPHEDRHGSVIGSKLARMGLFAWFETSDGKHSLRSTGVTDVSAVATRLGGGGHPQAAGFNKLPE